MCFVVFNLTCIIENHIITSHHICQGLTLPPSHTHFLVFQPLSTCFLPASCQCGRGSSLLLLSVRQHNCPRHNVLHKPAVNNPSPLYQILYAAYIMFRLNSTVYSVYLFFNSAFLQISPAAPSLDSGSPRMPCSTQLSN